MGVSPIKTGDPGPVATREDDGADVAKTGKLLFTRRLVPFLDIELCDLGNTWAPERSRVLFQVSARLVLHDGCQHQFRL